MKSLIVLAASVSLTGPLAANEENGFWWYAKAKVACLPDVVRLCGNAMPNEDKVRTCMKDKQAMVSASCADFYLGGKNAD